MKILRIAAVAAWATAAMAVASTLPAAPAQADVPPPIQFITQNVYASSASQAALGTVACPTGTFVVSANAYHTTQITSLTPLRNSRTSPNLANFTAVAATAYPYADQSGGAPYMTLRAACVPTSRLSNAVSRSITVASDRTNPFPGPIRGTVRCPAGMRAFGGGAYFLAPDSHISKRSLGMWENSVTSDGAGWTFRGYNQTKDRLVVTTQCAPLTGSHVVQPVGTPTPPPPTPLPGPLDLLVDSSARCPIGETALSGGFTFAHADHTEGSGRLTEVLTTFDGVFGGTRAVGNAFFSGDSLLIARTQCVPPGSF